MTDNTRLSTGVERLDDLLGGGLLPGTLCVVLGATGAGKTQFGLQFAHAGRRQEGHPGIVFDLSARGDCQHHGDYTRRMFGWELTPEDPDAHVELDGVFDLQRPRGDYLHVFDRRGRRVTRRDLDFDAWRRWQAELARRLGVSIAFFYGNFVRGVRRAVIDGVEPADRPSESIQMELFEYVYHQILRKDSEWVARDLFRQHFHKYAQSAASEAYDPRQIGCVLLVTSRESMLEALVERPLDEGDVLCGANTVIYLGKIRRGSRVRRAMYVAKHRGGPCPDDFLPYRIDERGIDLQSG